MFVKNYIKLILLTIYFNYFWYDNLTNQVKLYYKLLRVNKYELISCLAQMGKLELHCRQSDWL